MPDLEAMTGLHVMDRIDIAESQQSIVDRFDKFVASVSDVCPEITFIYWSGNDNNLLSLDKKGCFVDILTAYKSWLSLNNMSRRASLRLGDAIVDLMGVDFQFMAHRAFEDALMTYAVMNLITINYN